MFVRRLRLYSASNTTGPSRSNTTAPSGGRPTAPRQSRILRAGNRDLWSTVPVAVGLGTRIDLRGGQVATISCQASSSCGRFGVQLCRGVVRLVVAGGVGITRS